MLQNTAERSCDVAEEMGLGKTVEVLACIMANPYQGPPYVPEEVIPCSGNSTAHVPQVFPHTACNRPELSLPPGSCELILHRIPLDIWRSAALNRAPVHLGGWPRSACGACAVQLTRTPNSKGCGSSAAAAWSGIMATALASTSNHRLASHKTDLVTFALHALLLLSNVLMEAG